MNYYKSIIESQEKWWKCSRSSSVYWKLFFLLNSLILPVLKCLLLLYRLRLRTPMHPQQEADSLPLFTMWLRCLRSLSNDLPQVQTPGGQPRPINQCDKLTSEFVYRNVSNVWENLYCVHRNTFYMKLIEVLLIMTIIKWEWHI